MKLVKRYSNVGDLVVFELEYIDHFCLKWFSLFSTKDLKGRGQLRVQEGHCPANKIPSLLHKPNGKVQDSGNNANVFLLL